MKPKPDMRNLSAGMAVARDFTTEVPTAELRWRSGSLASRQRARLPRRRSALLIGLVAAIAVALIGVPLAAAATTERVSLAADGVETNALSLESAISGDGRFVAFRSEASNLVPGDSNEAADVFVRDRQNGAIERVSVAADGSEGNAFSVDPAISLDGRFVTFYSGASNLVFGDSNESQDVFIHDRQTGVTERVSLATDGSQGNHASFHPAVSADGRFVAFWSHASDLVPGDTNGASDVFIRDRETGTTQRVSVAVDGAQGDFGSHEPAISADGRFVAFWSNATNLVPGDSNGAAAADVFVRDRETGTTQRVSVSSDNSQGNASSAQPAISLDGRFVAFWSSATNLVHDDSNGAPDVFVHDRQTGDTQRVSVSSDGSEGNSSSFLKPAISGDGRFVGFQSDASNLVPSDTNSAADVFVHDRETGATERVSAADDDSQGNSSSFEPAISADGRFVAFWSNATNLVPGDTNRTTDVFVRDRSQSDVDGDGLPDRVDNCPHVSNADQSDIDGDGQGDACDPDRDGDGVANERDGCAGIPNPGQEDIDGDGLGDVCDPDRDGDGVASETDNCADIANADQADQDSDGFGDACDADRDGDGIVDSSDNCPTVDNPGQEDLDGDAAGDACDSDRDGDGVGNGGDNCPDVANTDQGDWDGDGQGDACDADRPPAQQIAETSQAVAQLPTTHGGTKTSLQAKLKAALAAYNAGDFRTACATLNSFMHETRAQRGKKLSEEDADRLIADAERIKAAIGCQI